jgi:hypothetical protein
MWLFNFIKELTELRVIFGISEKDFSDLKAVTSDFQEANIQANSSSATSYDRLSRKEKAVSTKKTVRQFINRHLRFNPAMTNELRNLLGMTVPDLDQTPASPPETTPKGTVDFSTHQKHKLRVKDSQSSGRAKPEHVRGFEVWHKFGEMPVNDGDFSYTGFSSSNRLIVNYPLDMVGTVVRYRFRWINTRSKPGPWSDIVSAIIN